MVQCKRGIRTCTLKKIAFERKTAICHTDNNRTIKAFRNGYMLEGHTFPECMKTHHKQKQENHQTLHTFYFLT